MCGAHVAAAAAVVRGMPAAGYLESTALLDLNYTEDAAGGPDISVALHPLTARLVLLQSDSR